jgi:RND family efflux transporter MFP subunit
MKRALLFFAFAIGLSSLAFAQPKGGPPAPTVVAEPVKELEITPSTLMLGTVMPPRKAVVGSAVEGRVDDVPVREGDPVQGPRGEGADRERGQTLAQVLTETINIELRGAKAELELRQHELAMIEIAQEEVVQAETKLKMSDALRVFAKSKLDRAESLFKQSRAATRHDYDEAISAAEAAEQTYRGAISSVKLAQEGQPLKEAAAKARVAVQQEEVNRIEDRLRKYTVRAPFDGFVSALHTETGAWIKQGDPVAEIIELAEVDIIVAVPENYVSFARKGAASQVTVDSLPGKQFSGEVVYVVPQADLKSRTFPVKIRVKNELAAGIPLLKAGMLARAQVAVGGEARGAVVRRDALVLDKENKYVFVADFDPQAVEEGPVRREKVTLGASDGTFVIVHGNVKPGDRVIIEGNERLRDKQMVKIKLKK